MFCGEGGKDLDSSLFEAPSVELITIVLNTVKPQSPSGFPLLVHIDATEAVQ